MREETGGYVYFLANKRYGTLYTGSTTELVTRVLQHRAGLCGFTRRYGVTRLVWVETHETIAAAYRREQLVKRWRRDWKIALIEENNPHWDDLFPVLSQHTIHPLSFPGRKPREGGAESRDPS